MLIVMKWLIVVLIYDLLRAQRNRARLYAGEPIHLTSCVDLIDRLIIWWRDVEVVGVVPVKPVLGMGYALAVRHRAVDEAKVLNGARRDLAAFGIEHPEGRMLTDEEIIKGLHAYATKEAK